VTVVHRRDTFRAERVMQQRLFNHPKIEVIWNSAVDEVLGKDGFPPSLTGVRLRNVKTNETRDLATDGLFIAIGHAPATSLFTGQVQLKESGYIWTAPDSTATSVPGVFAAGDVTDEHFRQAVTAAGMGCMAALEAERYIGALETETKVA